MQNYVIYDNAIVKPVSEISAEIVKTGHFKYVHSCYVYIVHNINNVHFHAQFIVQHFGVQKDKSFFNKKNNIYKINYRLTQHFHFLSNFYSRDCSRKKNLDKKLFLTSPLLLKIWPKNDLLYCAMYISCTHVMHECMKSQYLWYL